MILILENGFYHKPIMNSFDEDMDYSYDDDYMEYELEYEYYNQFIKSNFINNQKINDDMIMIDEIDYEGMREEKVVYEIH